MKWEDGIPRLKPQDFITDILSPRHWNGVMQELFFIPVVRGRNDEQFAEILLRGDKKMEGTECYHDLPILVFYFIKSLKLYLIL